MKKILLFILLASFNVTAFSQAKKTGALKKATQTKTASSAKEAPAAPKIKLADEIKISVADIVKKAASDNVVHDILFGIDMPSDNIRADKMAELLKLKLEMWNDKDTVMNAFDAAQLKKNLPVFTEYFNGMKKYGDMSASFYFIKKKPDFPLGFGHFNNEVTFVQYGVFSDIKYNTVKMVADDRSVAAIKRIILPGLFNFQPLLKIKEIQNFCLVTGYTAQDFGDKYFRKGETAAVLIPRDVLEKFLNAELSETEIISKIVAFSSNQSTNGNLKKLTL